MAAITGEIGFRNSLAIPRPSARAIVHRRGCRHLRPRLRRDRCGHHRCGTNGGVTHVGIAVTFGLIIFAMISAVGHISGAHFNPAVTIAFALGRPFPVAAGAALSHRSTLGALLASLLLRGLFGNVAHLGATLPHGSDGQSFVLEAVLTFFLMFVIFSVATDARAVTRAAAFAIGGTVGLEAMFAGPISGASMNPARSLAPALVERHVLIPLALYPRAGGRGDCRCLGLPADLGRRRQWLTDPCPLPLHA